MKVAGFHLKVIKRQFLFRGIGIFILFADVSDFFQKDSVSCLCEVPLLVSRTSNCQSQAV